MLFLQITEGIDVSVADHGGGHGKQGLRHHPRIHAADEIFMIRAERSGDSHALSLVDKVILHREAGKKRGEALHGNRTQAKALEKLHRSENIGPHGLFRMLQGRKHAL